MIKDLTLRTHKCEVEGHRWRKLKFLVPDTQETDLDVALNPDLCDRVRRQDVEEVGVGGLHVHLQAKLLIVLKCCSHHLDNPTIIITGKR